jgi:hypothetical protein
VRETGENLSKMKETCPEEKKVGIYTDILERD